MQQVSSRVYFGGWGWVGVKSSETASEITYVAYSMVITIMNFDNFLGGGGGGGGGIPMHGPPLKYIPVDPIT